MVVGLQNEHSASKIRLFFIVNKACQLAGIKRYDKQKHNGSNCFLSDILTKTGSFPTVYNAANDLL